MMDNVQLLFTHALKDGVDFWVHLEDDWNFVKGNFITDGIKVLDYVGANSSIWMVLGRHYDNSHDGHANTTFGYKNTVGNSITFGALNFLRGWHNKWGSWSANP